jgi:tetratricopeptide (TPR) repeat protein
VTSISAEQVNSLLDKAAQADIVRALGHGRYRFSHALIREALYTEMDTNSRLRLHRRIGEVMEEIHSSDPGPHLAELAHHFGEARVANKAIDYMTRAGKAAEAIYAYGEATHWYSSAIQAIERRGPANPATELEVLLALARAHFHGGSFPACKEAFARAAEVARGLRAWDSFASAVLGLTGHPQDALLRQPDSKLLALVEEALAMHREDDSLRSMLLSRLAVETHLRGEHSSAESLFGQAIDMARSIGDRNALFNALNSRAFFRVFGPEGDELRELTATAREASDPDAFWLGFSWEFRLHVTMGNVEAIDTSIEEYSLIADKSRLPGFQSVRSAVLGMRALMAGRLREGERFCEEAMRILEPWERLDPGQMFPLILALRREEGRLDEMASLAHRASEMFPSFLFGRASHAQLLLETGGEADARVAFEQLAINNFGDVPPDTNWLPTLALLADVCARLRDLRRAGILYHLLLPHAGRNAHFLILTCYGPISHYLGMLAATLSHYEEAEQHFRSALEFTSRMKAHLLTAYAQRDYASMLLERGGPGDRQKALALLGDTVRMAQTLGLKRLSAELKTLEHAGAAGSDFETPASGRVGNVSEAHLHPKAGELPNHIFRREGEIWTIVHGAMTTRLRDAKGLGYLAYLLAHPGERIHVLDLVTMVEGGAAAEGSAARPRARGQADDIETVRGLGDAGPALDLRARAEYKRRLGELHAELEEAEGFNDAGHAERIRGEIEFLGAELSAAVGIGGRGRKTAAHAERTRQTVSKSIRAIIKKIRHRDRSLGHHLGTCIKTGYFCAYLPEPDRRIDWHF